MYMKSTLLMELIPSTGSILFTSTRQVSAPFSPLDQSQISTTIGALEASSLTNVTKKLTMALEGMTVGPQFPHETKINNADFTAAFFISMQSLFHSMYSSIMFFTKPKY